MRDRQTALEMGRLRQSDRLHARIPIGTLYIDTFLIAKRGRLRRRTALRIDRKMAGDQERSWKSLGSIRMLMEMVNDNRRKKMKSTEKGNERPRALWAVQCE